PRAAPTHHLFPYTTLFRSREWLDIGDELEVRCEREALGLSIEGMITLRARIERVDEVSTARHIFAASLVDPPEPALRDQRIVLEDRKSTRLNSSHVKISYA